MNKKYKTITFITLLIISFFIVVFPDVSRNGAIKGLLISANVLVPSLYPFLICILMLMNLSKPIKNKKINNILYKILGHNFEMFFAFLLSLVGGYPVGAKLINELYCKKTINKKTANIMLTYCVNAGPSFIICAVGKSFNSSKIGIILLVSHLLSSITIALLCSKKIKIQSVKNMSYISIEKSFSTIFTQSVSDATESIIKICSFVTLFTTLNSIFDYMFSNMPILKYITLLTEVSSAVVNSNNIYITSFLLGFSGLSICFQIFAITDQININKKIFISGRISHGILSIIFTKILISVFNIKINVYSNNIDFKKQTFYTNNILFVSMTIMIIVFLVFIHSKNNSRKIIDDML